MDTLTAAGVAAVVSLYLAALALIAYISSRPDPDDELVEDQAQEASRILLHPRLRRRRILPQKLSRFLRRLLSHVYPRHLGP